MRSCGDGRDMRTCWRAVARSTREELNEIGSSRKGAVPAWERCMARTRVRGPALFEKIKADHGGLTRAIDKEGL